MENLARQLADQYNLETSEARAAIMMVADFLKKQHPGLGSLIDHALLDHSDAGGEED